jgi:hypothetical protein
MTRSCPERMGGVVSHRIAVVTLVMLAAGSPRAADDEFVDAASPLQATQESNFVELGTNFYDQVFNQDGGLTIHHDAAARASDEKAQSRVTARVRKMGATHLAAVERACTLSDAQRRKLELAIESDVRRCVGGVEEIRRRYADMKVDLNDREGQQQWNRFQQDVTRCRRRVMTAFTEGSLFAEALSTVLDEGQASNLATEQAARRTFRWQSLVARAMIQLDDALTLTEDQHAEVERMLLAKEPRLRIEGWSPERNQHAEQMLVFMVLADVDQKALRAVVGEGRWKSVVTFANQGRAMRTWIQQQGLLEPPPK